MASLRLVQKICFILFFISGVLLQVACGPESSQYTNKMAADPFVAPLNSKVTKIVALDLEPGQKIAWMGLNRSGDYRFFQIDEVKLNGKKFTAKTPGPEYVFNSFPPVAAVSGASAETATTAYVTLTYKAKTPHVDPQTPFKAYLLIVMEEGSGRQGSILVNLEGYVRGVCDDCKLPLDKAFKYELADNDGDGDPDFGLYLCDSKALDGKVTTFNKPSDPDFQPPANINPANPYRFDFINVTGEKVADWKTPPQDFVLFTSDKKPGHIIIDAGDKTDIANSPPSIPPFLIPVPGEKPVPTVDVQIVSGSQVACPFNSADNTFTCSDENDSGIGLRIFDSVGLNASLLTLTSGSVDVSSKDCPNFGTWQGKGDVVDGTKDLTLVGFASISDDQPNEVKSAKTDIEGAAVIAIIKLKPIL